MLCGLVYIAINIDFLFLFLALYIFRNLTTMYGCSLLSWVWLCGCGLMWQQVVVVRLRTCHNRLLAHISVQENEAGTIAMQSATAALETRQLGECAL